MHIWQHRGSVVRYLALYGFHVVAFVANMVAFLPWGAPRGIHHNWSRGARSSCWRWGRWSRRRASAPSSGRPTWWPTVADLAEPPGYVPRKNHRRACRRSSAQCVSTATCVD